MVPIERVREAITVLLDRETHPFFIAYLHLRQQASRQGTLLGLQPDWSELSETLYVPGGPPKKPHLRPFWSGKRDAGQEWLNENLAGSYAPSSLRSTASSQVVDVDANHRFVLKDDHPAQALRYLLRGIRLPVVPLAAFLFRDRGVLSEQPQDTDLVTVFRNEYGYRASDDAEFATLYDAEWGLQPEAPLTWLEPWKVQGADEAVAGGT